MKLAIPLENNSKQSEIAHRFAWAKYYAIVDRETSTLEILPNPCLGINTQVGKCTLLYLTTRKNVDTLVAYGYGLNIQQIALEENIQLILIDEKRKNLSQLFKIMNFQIVK